MNAVSWSRDAIKTIDHLRSKGYTFTFLTNTDSRSTTDAWQRLLGRGLNISFDELLTPVSAVKRFIEVNRNSSYHFLVHDDVQKELDFAMQDDQFPDYIVIGDFCDKVTYEVINKAFRMIRNGTEIIALSKTLWYKDDDGVSLNTGAFVNMLETATNKKALLMGKPSVDFLKMALDRAGSKPENTLVVGDDISTDIFGGHLLGARTVQVQTGVYDPATSVYKNISPDFVIPSIASLAELLFTQDL